MREALADERPLQIVGVPNAYIARMAERLGIRALYLSGACVANFAFCLPDLGLTTREQVAEEARRIAEASELPLLVDCDTGWGDPGRTVEALMEAGASAIHIEDQVAEKRCGHRPGKKIVSVEEMVERIRAAVTARRDSAFLIMARSDAFATEGMEGLIHRLQAYELAGADLLFPEALTSLSQYQAVKEAVGVPVLANLTEFGKTPLFTTDELHSIDIDMALYPLTVARVMNRAAEQALQEIFRASSQETLLDRMQTREELYNYLNYHEFEEKC